MQFTKMHGIGNDFVLLDGVGRALPEADWEALARRMCDRHRGVGADGLILGVPGEHAPLRMRMFNPDGSESEMCGNGIRCLAVFARDQGWTAERSFVVETGNGPLALELFDGGLVRVDMGPARLLRGEIGMKGEPAEPFVDQPLEAGGKTYFGTAVSMGNPHLVVFLDPDEPVELSREGPALEHHELFPARTNVHFVAVSGPGELRQRTWERGAGATLACGTGACASAVAAFLTGRAGRDTEVELPGGVLRIEYREDGRVFMTGPAVTVFRGDWPEAAIPGPVRAPAGSLSP